MIPNCLQCGTPMIKAGKKKTKKSYKAHKWKCPSCDYSEMEFGSNGIDSNLIDKTQRRGDIDEEPYENEFDVKQELLDEL